MNTTDETLALPKSVLTFYIDLYCKRKVVKLYPRERLSLNAKRQRMIIDAKKSWYALSKSERQQINIKYNEYRAKIKEKISNSLKEAEPFMKIKDINKNKLVGSTETTVENNEQAKGSDEVNPDVTLQTEKTAEFSLQEKQEEQTESCNIETGHGNVNHDMEQIVLWPQEESKESDKDSVSGASVQTKVIETIISEPAPPNVKTGEELFNMIKSNTEYDCWSSVPTVSRRRYFSAVHILKQDYIEKYKRYLESLSPQELFNHYNNKTSF